MFCSVFNHILGTCGGKIEALSTTARLTTHFTYGLMSAVMICKQRKEYGHAWLQMSILRQDVIKHHKLELIFVVAG